MQGVAHPSFDFLPFSRGSAGLSGTALRRGCAGSLVPSESLIRFGKAGKASRRNPVDYLWKIVKSPIFVVYFRDVVIRAQVTLSKSSIPLKDGHAEFNEASHCPSLS